MQRHAREIPDLATQQAWNYAGNGFVAGAAEKRPKEVLNRLLLRTAPTRLSWNPLPQELKILKGHTTKVRIVAITPDGKMALSGSEDNTCILWDLESGGKRAQFFNTSNINAITSFPRGILGGSQSGETFILHTQRELLCPDIGIITARKIWDFEFKQ